MTTVTNDHPFLKRYFSVIHHVMSEKSKLDFLPFISRAEVFVEEIFTLYPAKLIMAILHDAVKQTVSRQAVYEHIQENLKISKLELLKRSIANTRSQADLITDQAIHAFPDFSTWNGLFQNYLEIGTQGMYFNPFADEKLFVGERHLLTDVKPSLINPAHIVQRGWIPRGLRRNFTFWPLTYDPVSPFLEERFQLVSSLIGLHHCLEEKLDQFVSSIARSIMPGGFFLLREHNLESNFDGFSEDRLIMAIFAHELFNAATGVTFAENEAEIRNFQTLKYFSDILKKHGLRSVGTKPLYQQMDPTFNALVVYQKEK